MNKINTNTIRVYIGAIMCMFLSTIGIFLVDKYSISYEKYVIDYYNITDEYTYVPFGWKIAVILFAVGLVGFSVASLRALKSIWVYFICIAVFVLAQWHLLLYADLYMPILEYILFTTVTYVGLYIYKKVLHVRTARYLPIDAVVKFIADIVNSDIESSYSEYMLNHKKNVEKSLSARLVNPVLKKDDILIQRIVQKNHHSRKKVENILFTENAHRSKVVQIKTSFYKDIKYLVFFPLPIFDKEEEDSAYTVIGTECKLGVQQIAYLSTMLFCMYIYFKAKEERGAHQKVYFSMVSLMISVIDAKDPVTAGHSQRVAQLSKELGKWMNLDKNLQFDLEFASLIHDIGKIGVSDYVLHKPSIFTQNDFAQMKNHTIRGAEMLEEVGMNENIIDGVRHHHERIDGLGYPDGLHGNQLNIISKIIKIADVFDALTSKRQYKDAWNIEKALNIIYRGRGTEFDNKIADVFIEHMAPESWIPPIESKGDNAKSDPFMEKAISIAVDFYQRYQNNIVADINTESINDADIDYKYDNDFLGFDWGETFTNAEFLDKKPLIVAYEKETDSLVFCQKSEYDDIDNIYYYFYKGFVNMGVFLIDRNKVWNVISDLNEAYGEPSNASDQIMVYRHKKLRIVFYHTSDDKCLLFYTPEYICSNYKFVNSSNGSNGKNENCC